MEFEKLPDDNDVIIMGTGMIESIVSAASSRIELNVLNVDKNDYYGGCWGSFNLNGFKEFLTSKDDDFNSEIISNDILGENETFIPLERPSNFIKNIQEYDYPSRPIEASAENLSDVAKLTITTDPDENNENEKEVISEEVVIADKKCRKYDDLHDKMITKQRYFVLDLLPKMMFSRGAIVDLLISSDVARYCEFSLVSRILTVVDSKFESVPSSRSEVFSTTAVNVIDKRMLMKFLTFALEFEKHEDEFKDCEATTFVEYLKEKKLSPLVQHYVRHAIAMVPQDAGVVEGLKSTKKYLTSLGRFGKSALLSPIYGTGELLQCFCRMSAVFGGVYCLRRTLLGAIAKENKIVALVDSQGQRLNTKWFLLESIYASQFVGADKLKTSSISRAILITDKSVLPDKEKRISLANIPSPTNPGKHVIMQELLPTSRACPEDLCVVHLTCEGANAESDLRPLVEKHFHLPALHDYEMNDDKPNVMWMVFFNIESVCEAKTVFENLILVPGPIHELDCDSSISTAESIFKQMYPDKDFLPRAPSPEEIVFHEATEENMQTEGQMDEMKEESATETSTS